MKYKPFKPTAHGKPLKHVRIFFLWFIVSLSPFNSSAENRNTSFETLYTQLEQKGFASEHAPRLLDSLYGIAGESPDSLVLTARCIYAEVSINQYSGKNDTTLCNKIKNLEKRLDKGHYPFEAAILNLSLSINYYLNGDYALAFASALLTLEQFKKIANNKYTAGTLAILGNICSAITSYDLAEEYYKQALHFTSDIQQRNRINMNIYNIWGLSGQTAIAIDSLYAMLPVFKQNKDTMLLSRSYLNLGNYYAMQGELPKAKACYDTLLTLAPSLRGYDLTFGIYQNMGAYYMYMQDSKEALKYFTQAKNVALRENRPERLIFAYFGLSKTFEQMGQTDSAFAYIKQYAALNDSNIEKTKSLEAYRAYVTATIESTRKELTIAEQDIELKNRRFITTIGFSIGIIMVITLFLIVVQQKKRFREAENKDLKERLESTQLIERLQEERIDAQMREITSHSLMLSNKNEVLQQIAEVVKQMPASQKRVREINQIIRNNLNTDHAWEDFMLHFEKVHPDFFNKLSGINKDLTKNDLRLCAYLRIGIAQKQIAQILNVSYGSIRFNRYRLKKKLGLGEEHDLDEFLRNI